MDTRYELGDALGRGGMGEVREALDRQIGRRVAIKTIRSGQPSERMIARFLREARIQGRLEHPAIPAVHELGTDADGRPFFVMKKLAGTTLSKLLRDKSPPTRQRLLRAFADVCLAVELAHVHGIVHRDLKPDNIVLGEFGEVYVLDWGVAKIIGEDDSFDDIVSDDLQTRAGAVLGSPGYMSPEQARGETVDARADVYSLGVVLRDILDVGDDAPPELRQLCTCAMEPVRDERVHTARALAEGVQRYLDGDRDLSQRRTLAAEHFERARAAFVDAGDRATAMREAGRALALDPQLEGAGDLIGRLMLEPPKETPVVVEQALHAELRQRYRSAARTAMWCFLAFAGFLPNIITSPLGKALVVVMAVSFSINFVASRRDVSPWWVAVSFGPIIALVARMFSPTLVAPGLTAVIAGGLAMLLPSRRSSIALWGLMCASVLIPLAAERLGWLSTTLDEVPGGYFLHTPLIANTAFGASIRGALFVVVLVATAIILSYFARRTDEELRRRLHLQAWQLRQLFPDRTT